MLVLWPAVAWGHGAFHDRLVELQGALAVQPDDAALHFELAWVFCEHGDWQPALDEIARVEQLAPGVFPADLVRGCAWRAAGRLVDACAALDRHLATHPGDGRALVERARAREAAGRADDALADYRAVIAAMPRAEEDLVLEIAEAMAGHGCPNEAIALIDAATQRIGAFPALLSFALDLELGGQRFDAALRYVEALQKVAPRPEPWMARRAEILARAGRVAEARAAWDRLLTHLEELPNLERGTPLLRALAERARAALADSVTTPTDS